MFVISWTSMQFCVMTRRPVESRGATLTTLTTLIKRFDTFDYLAIKTLWTYTFLPFLVKIRDTLVYSL